MQEERSLKQDCVHLAILLAVALAIGAYLIATSELISRDGAFYIHQARKLLRDPAGVARQYPLGYPVLLLAGQKIVSLFTAADAAAVWVWSSQAVTLLCRVLALVPLYFVGRFLVGARKSFWALLVLTVLPYPARYGSDVLREWPFLLFLALGFWFLLVALREGKWWLFGLVGLAAGLGYLIRPMSGQLVVYALLGLIVTACVGRPASKLSLVGAGSILLVAFAIPTVPYFVWIGTAVPQQFNTVPADAVPVAVTVAGQPTDASTAGQEEKTPFVLRAADHVFSGLADNLMIFFLVPLGLGLYHRLRHEAGQHERALMIAVVLLNVGLIAARYTWFGSGSARRYSLGLIVLTICYVPGGLERLAHGLRLAGDRVFGDRGRAESGERVWFAVLLAVGVGLCVPKLLAPMHADKKGYRQVARWLGDNTEPGSVIIVSDARISFYADRPGRIQGHLADQRPSNYTVTITPADSTERHPEQWRELYACWADESRKERLTVYRTRAEGSTN